MTDKQADAGADNLPPLPWGDDFEAWLEPRTEAEIAGAMQEYALAALRAQQPAPQAEPGWRDCPDCEGSGRISAVYLCQLCRESGIVPDAPQAAAQQPIAEQLTKKRIGELWIGVVHIEHATNRQIAFARAIEAELASRGASQGRETKSKTDGDSNG